MPTSEATLSIMKYDKSTNDLRAALGQAFKGGKHLSTYMPLVVRLLLVSTFLEDGVQVMLDLGFQISFLRHEYYIPDSVATLLLLGYIFISFSAVAVILLRKRLVHGRHESHAAYVLIGCLLYQQLLYGRHSAIATGNLGFFVRNLSLSGSILLVSCQAQLRASRPAFPMGILDTCITDKKMTVAYMQLASRVLLVLLAFEFIVTLGSFYALFTIPVIIAVLVGFKLKISGCILLLLYCLHNVLNSAFWQSHHPLHMSHVMRYEFFQTLSIMAGLLLLILTGPGAISVDEMRCRKSF